MAYRGQQTIPGAPVLKSVRKIQESQEYGVKGMKWGQRKQQPHRGRVDEARLKSMGGQLKQVSQGMNSLKHPEHRRIVRSLASVAKSHLLTASKLMVDSAFTDPDKRDKIRDLAGEARDYADTAAKHITKASRALRKFSTFEKQQRQGEED